MESACLIALLPKMDRKMLCLQGKRNNCQDCKVVSGRVKRADQSSSTLAAMINDFHQRKRESGLGSPFAVPIITLPDFVVGCHSRRSFYAVVLVSPAWRARAIIALAYSAASISPTTCTSTEYVSSTSENSLKVTSPSSVWGSGTSMLQLKNRRPYHSGR